MAPGRRLYAHRILLTLFSDYFRRALACGMRETYEPDIIIEDISYDTPLGRGSYRKREYICLECFVEVLCPVGVPLHR